jgi:hypothetical protein
VDVKGFTCAACASAVAWTWRQPPSAAVALADCYLAGPDPVKLNQATASRLSLIGCQLAGLTADVLTARGLDLRRSTGQKLRTDLAWPTARLVGSRLAELMHRTIVCIVRMPQRHPGSCPPPVGGQCSCVRW